MASPPPGVASRGPPFVAASRRVLDPPGRYPPFSERYRLFGPITLSRGCANACTYCQTPQLFPRMDHVPVGRVIEFLEMAVGVGYRRAWFLSPNALAYGSPDGLAPDPSALLGLLDGIASVPGLDGINIGTFPSEVRPEFVTEEIMDILEPRVTNRYLVIGAQNVSNRLLESINRGHDWESVLRAIDILGRRGWEAWIDLILGLPGETEGDILLNLEFLEALLAGEMANVRIHAHTFMPLPGTPLENEPHGTIDPRMLRAMGQLSTLGRLDGSFLVQEAMSGRERASRKGRKNRKNQKR